MNCVKVCPHYQLGILSGLNQVYMHVCKWIQVDLIHSDCIIHLYLQSSNTLEVIVLAVIMCTCSPYPTQRIVCYLPFAQYMYMYI